MFNTSRRLASMATSSAIKTSVASLMACALGACGGGSDESALGRTLTSAKTTAVASGQSSTDDQAKRVTPYDLPSVSKNRAMQKLAKIRCDKHPKMHRVDDKKGQAKQSERNNRCEAAEAEAAG